MCYLTWKFRFWRGADSLGPHFSRIVDKSQPQISVEIIVAPGDSSRRVWNVRNVQGNLKRHVRVYHVQNLKSVKSRRRVKISPVHRLWSHHRMPVAIRTCWTSFQTPKYTPPGSNFDRTEAFFPSHLARILIRHHIGISARLKVKFYYWKFSCWAYLIIDCRIRQKSELGSHLIR